MSPPTPISGNSFLPREATLPFSSTCCGPGTLLSNCLILTHLISIKTIGGRVPMDYFLVNIAVAIL